MLEHILFVAASAISSYSRTISRQYSLAYSPSTRRSLVSKQNSRGGLFKAFYRSLDQRSRLSLSSVYLRHRWRCVLGTLIGCRRAGYLPSTFRLLPLADPKANPRRATKCVSRVCSRRECTRAMDEMHALYHCGNAYEIRHSHARKWKYDLPLCSPLKEMEGMKRRGKERQRGYEFNITSRTA